jgi:hypothetical protein
LCDGRVKYSIVEPRLVAYEYTTSRGLIWDDLESKWYARDESGQYIYKVNKTGRKQRIKIIPKDIVVTP